MTYQSSGLAPWESDSEAWGRGSVFFKCSFVCLSFACTAPADPLEEGSRQLREGRTGHLDLDLRHLSISLPETTNHT